METSSGRESVCGRRSDAADDVEVWWSKVACRGTGLMRDVLMPSTPGCLSCLLLLKKYRKCPVGVQVADELMLDSGSSETGRILPGGYKEWTALYCVPSRSTCRARAESGP